MTLPDLPATTTTTVAPLGGVNATENVTETENVTVVPELMNATANVSVNTSDEMPVLVPPGAAEPVQVTIGNETVVADLPPTVPPRVEVAMAVAVEAAKDHAAQRVADVILPHNRGAWVQHFASTMQQLSLAG